MQGSQIWRKREEKKRFRERKLRGKLDRERERKGGKKPIEREGEVTDLEKV